MDVHKFYAKTSREGINKVKEALGGEAIILGSRKHVKGVEIIATSDVNKDKLEPYFDNRENTRQNSLSINALADNVSKDFSKFTHQAEGLMTRHKTPKPKSTPTINTPAAEIVESNINRENQLSLLQQEHALNGLKSDLLNIKQLLDSQSFNSQVIYDHEKQTDRQIVALRKELKQMQSDISINSKKAQNSQVPVVKYLQKEMKALRNTISKQQKPVIKRMSSEISVLKDSLQNQFEVAGWSRWSETNPMRAAMLVKLAKIGLTQELSQKIIAEIDENTDKTLAWRQTLGIWAKEMGVTHDNIIKDGGRIALVGPTGVGKTTTIAKLASKFITRHGENSVALISYDHYRIGAHDQLMTYGRLIGAPVITAMHRNELSDILASLHHKKLILIDTAGMSPNNPGFNEHIQELQNQSLDAENQIDHYLTISANTQYSSLNKIIDRYSSLNLKAAILSKTDEAVNFGDVISAVLERKVPVAYITTGQTVPNDIEEAKITKLISKSVSLAAQDKKTISSSTMAKNYGPMVARVASL